VQGFVQIWVAAYGGEPVGGKPVHLNEISGGCNPSRKVVRGVLLQELVQIWVAAGVEFPVRFSKN
jgi:hypothetical protein